ncbi:MAG: bifunctional [glutamate--ammonia ligase]-adenylyl-L-tyrosine phosphorylase/[glutamate--ammonia-ligase] adenylyltransferase [Wenzhouxiangella sp.]
MKRAVRDLSIEQLAASCRFVAEAWRRFPDHPNPGQPVERPDVETVLTAPETSLRRYRQLQSAHILWQDLSGNKDIVATGKAISALARDCLALALVAAEHQVAQTCGALLDEHDQPIRLIVFGLGKLGGDELNFNSDIDLVFAYRGQGGDQGTSSGPRKLDAARYLQLVARELIRLLDTVTEQGRVWIVDTRLRPFGEAGALVWSTAAMEQYFLQEGRTWERYAWLKAAPVAGDITGGQRLLETLRPFIFKRYLDYGIFDSLRELHARIEASSRSSERHDIKRGSGGIRAAEFLVQSQQILRGGRERLLRTTGFLPALEACTALGLIAAEPATKLRDAYSYLRLVENRLQAQSGRQGHHLPDSAQDMAGLAFLLGHASSEDFARELARQQSVITRLFGERFREPDRPSALPDGLWPPGPEMEASLERAGFSQAEASAALLRQLHQRLNRRALSAEGHRRLERLMPNLLARAAEQPQIDQVLPDLLHLVEQISRRSAYLSLLHERPQTLERLVRVFAASAVVSQWITRSPQLLDDLLDPVHGLDLPALPSLDPNEPEDSLNALGHWRQAGFLRTALAELDERISAQEAAERLSLIAETIVREILVLSGAAAADIAVIGYGNLGARLLHYQSDLDLVFLHAADPPPLRQAQRLISLMQMPLLSGKLFEIDTRLRPNGRAGLLVSRLDSFADYQGKEAWIWEHQALLRARWVAGSQDLESRFEQVRQKVLCRPRERETVLEALAEMRARQRRERSENALKRQLTDVQYLAEAGVLCLAAKHPELISQRRADAQLDALAALGWLPERLTAELKTAWTELTAERHLHWLKRTPDNAEASKVHPAIAEAWQSIFGS